MGGALTIPVLVWVLAALLPQRLGRQVRLSHVSGAIGQYMLFQKATYERIGGYEGVRDQVADDFALVWKLKTAGFRAILADGSGVVRCRMYQRPKDIINGLGKNLFPVFNHRPALFSFAWTWLLVVSWGPVSILLNPISGKGVDNSAVVLSLAAVSAALTSWWIVFRRFKIPQLLALAYPLIILSSAFLAVYSAVQFWRGRGSWKGRPLPGRAAP